MYAVSDPHGNLLRPREVSISGYAADLIKEENKEKYIQKSEKRTITGFHKQKQRHYSQYNADLSGLMGDWVIYVEEKGTFYILGVYIGGNTACWIITTKLQQSLQ